MSFKFNLSDRVRIKTEDLGNIEGVVSGAKAMLNQGNEYDVHYLLPDLRMQHIVIPEDALAEMQPTKNTISLGLTVDQAPLDEALGKARELKAIVQSTVGRVGQIAKRPRRKANRSSKRR